MSESWTASFPGKELSRRAKRNLSPAVINCGRNLAGCVGLVHTVGAAKIDDLKDNNKFDLAGFVELTDRGKHYMKRVTDVQEGQDHKG